MLNRVEAKIMDYLFDKCRGKKTVLMSPKEILQSLLPKIELTAKQLDTHMKNLALDGYIEVFNSDKNGVAMYVVTLKLKGEGFLRERAEIRNRRLRSIGWKIMLSILGFVVVSILWAIF